MIKKSILFLCLALVHASYGQETDAAKAQHTILGQNAAGYSGAQDVRINSHPDAQWFPAAGLGLFIHFGLAAVHGGIDLSWGMYANKSWEDGELVPEKYWGLADQWDPKNFNPKDWIDVVAQAGFKYIVLTTKHHDGYTLWPSNYGELGVKQKMKGRDLVQEVVDACRKKGLKIGFYYSPPDWYFDQDYINWDYSGKSVMNTSYEKIGKLPQMTEQHKAKKRDLVRGQLKELLSNYGKIDLLWFDGGAGEMTNDEVRALQPGIVINRRNGEVGDYADSEGVLPTKRFNSWFETCDPCWPQRWWSYSNSDRMMTGDEAIEKLIILRGWNGNYLANVGPAADGSIPKEAIEAWKTMATWMKHSAESVFETTSGDFPEKSNQPVTRKGKDAYVHVFPNFHKTVEMDVNQSPKKAVLLRTGKSVPFLVESGKLKMNIEPHDRTRMVDVVKLIW